MDKLILGWREFSQFTDFSARNNKVFEAIVDDTELQSVRVRTNYASRELTIKYKFFAEILYSQDIIYTRSPSIPTAATDGARIFINPSFFAKLTDRELTLVLIHEIMHIALLHTTRQAGRDNKRWNYAGDYEINGLLVKDAIITGDELTGGNLKGLYKKEFLGKNAEQLYDDPNMTVPPPSPPPPPGSGPGMPGEGDPGEGQPGQSQPGEGEGQGSGTPTPTPSGPGTGEVIPKAVGDAIAKEEGYPDKAAADEQKIKDKVRDAANKHLNPRTKSMGKGGGSGIYDRIMELTETKIDWRKELSRFIGRIAMSSEFKMPARRHISSGQYLHGIKDKEEALERAIVALDVSGSVAAAFPEFASEVVGIAKGKKIQTIAVLPFADRVKDDFIIKGFRKPTPEDFKQVRVGGGTEAIPHVIDWVDKNFKGTLDVAVIVTDGWLTGGLPPAPKKWGRKTIWLVFDNPTFQVPGDWGQVIHVKGDPGYWR